MLHSSVPIHDSLSSQPKNKSKDPPKAGIVQQKKEAPVQSLPVRKVNDPLAIRTIVVSGLPSSINQKTLWKKLRKFEGAENVEWPAKTAGGEDLSTGKLSLSLGYPDHLRAEFSICIVLVI